jgi:glutathione S-transferase
MTLRVYYDLMSQPSRAIYLFLKVANIPFESCLVKLREGG